MPPITLWFLQTSRSIRTAWLLEELNLDYDVKYFDRMPDMKAPPDFKKGSGNPLGKAPTLQDGKLTVFESGAITEYLCKKYDKTNRLMGNDEEESVKILEWIHASEATFMLHALAITYARWNTPQSAKDDGTLAKIEEGMSVNVQKDLDWLEAELSSMQSKGQFLCGNHVTAADVMMQFSIDFVFTTKLGTQGKEWPNTRRWLEACAETETYERAVKKTGHRMQVRK